MTPEDELLGADFTEHSIVYDNINYDILQPMIKPAENNKNVNETNETNEPYIAQNLNTIDRARAVQNK